ncbi:zinc finger protein OZF [Folsomia candida]|uniref:zinc finger protein OZF n=1 Tax=Folsomia candida TaxID=158441 RepID=UPI000B8F4644|nr:zinc finger protein OZF [Folsomia candida]
MNDTEQKLPPRQKTTVPTMKKVGKGDCFHERGRFPHHSVQLREPTPRDDNHVQSPSDSSRSSKVKKLPQIGNKKIFPCKICLRPFTNRTSAHLHARTHLNSDERERSSLFQEKCPHCKKAFFDRHYFTDHVAPHEGRKNHACLICNQKFAHKTDMTRHLFVHMSGEERAEVRQGWRHGCYFCSKRFKAPSKLSRHLLVHTTEKVGGRCHTCRKSFTSKDSLTNHRFSHLSEDEKAALVKQGTGRECLFCKKKFPDNRTYRSHLASHTKEKPFPCDQCEKQYSARSSLNLHKRIHTSNPKRYKCDECGQAFSQKHHLARHQKTVHRKLKDIECPKCGKMFGTKGDMVEHLRGVHLKIRHPCPHCGHKATQKSNLKRHLRKIHPQELSPAHPKQ